MSSAFRRALPARADLEQQKTLAKELFAAFRSGESEARARVRAELPDKQRIVLADAQFVIAREYGFASWRDLKEKIVSPSMEAEPPIEQFKRAVQNDDAEGVHRVLQKHAEA